MADNWAQIGEDFSQKYEGTFCRYVSPISKQKEVFTVVGVHSNRDKGPDIDLFNGRVGELSLSYATEAELDFSFPEVGMFQFEKKAFRFARKFQRQWRKGVCDATADVRFPYAEIAPRFRPGLTEAVMEAAFKEQKITSISEAIRLLEDQHYVSVVLNRDLSLGLSEKQGKFWLWYDCEPIAEVTDSIKLHVPQFNQEVRDFIRDTRDYVRPVV